MLNNLSMALLSLVLLGACASQNTAVLHIKPDPIAVQARKQAVTTANRYATEAAFNMLEKGGSATDAAIAAQMVLGLVEPQSSGIGGGTLVMHWDAQTASLSSFDGLAAAPSRVTAALNRDADGRVIPREDVLRGGRSIGVPGTLSVLKMLHERYGKLPWECLFDPAIKLAREGFALPAYLHAVLSSPTAARDHPNMVPLYFGADNKPLPIGTLITNPAYARTMTRLAELGPAGLWSQGAGIALLAATQRGALPSMISEADFRSYRAEQREPLCAPFLNYKICAMGPTSFGGIVVLQVMQMLEARLKGGAAVGRFNFDDAEFAHFYAEAGRLAQADRQHYVGDPAYVQVPAAKLISSSYARERASLIDPNRSLPVVRPGLVEPKAASLTPAPVYETADATSQLAIVDAAGNALSMTTTINLNFGSRLMVDGYVLNNAMTNFSDAPRPGQSSPNRMQPGKRPVTSMAPIIVFDAAGKPVVVGGSAGGGQIVDYIASSLVEMLANQRTPAQALARGHVSTAVAGKVQLEKESPAAALAPALQAKGHTVEVVPMTSGLGFLLRQGDGWIGAADPRRDGVALGL